jgi:hypothetical protein
LYGSANSIHFENYPPSWRTAANQTSFAIYRGIFILALLPILVTLTGAAMEIYGTIKGVLTKDIVILGNVSYGLFAFLFVGYILFSALYALEYRIYVVMKAVFIYPGLLAFLVFFLKAVNIIFFYTKTRNWAVIGSTVWIIALLFLYVLDVTSLVFHLLPNQSGINIIMDSLMRIRQ